MKPEEATDKANEADHAHNANDSQTSAREGPRLFTTPPWAPAEALSGASYSAAELSGKGDRVYLLEQRELPEREVFARRRLLTRQEHAIEQPQARASAAFGAVLPQIFVADALGRELLSAAHDDHFRLAKQLRKGDGRDQQRRKRGLVRVQVPVR